MIFTCVSCGLEFSDTSSQRYHMKSDWHRYNLKRRVAQLPPIDETTFMEKISRLGDEGGSNQSSSKSDCNSKKLQRREDLKVEKQRLLEARKILQDKSFSNHPGDVMNSNQPSCEDDTPLPSSLSNINIPDSIEVLMQHKIDNRVDIPLTTCLFCSSKSNKNFSTLEENLDHMLKNHGLYIPERSYIIDIGGLIKYLGEKIGLGNVCLACSYQGKNIEAVREHMRSKRHMRVPYETEDEKLEYSDFYDFTSSYPQASYDSSNEQNDGDWEDISDPEDETNLDPMINTGTELILPSGIVLGHRSMSRYYRQNLPPDKVLSEGQGTIVAADSRHFASQTSNHPTCFTKREWSQKKKRDDINDRRAAKFINNQPHYRDPLLQ